MPYVNKEIRRQTRAPLTTLIDYVKELPDNARDGALNYLISELVGNAFRPAGGWRYHYLHRAYGVFLAAGAEFYRRLVAPYEDKAIENNGDITAYVRPQEEAGNESA